MNHNGHLHANCYRILRKKEEGGGVEVVSQEGGGKAIKNKTKRKKTEEEVKVKRIYYNLRHPTLKERKN